MTINNVNRKLTTDIEQWKWDYGKYNGHLDNEKWTMDNEQWIIDSEQWTIDNRQWVMHNELSSYHISCAEGIKVVL